MKGKAIEQRLCYSYILGCIAIILISLSVTLYYSMNRQTKELDDIITSMAAVIAGVPMVVSALEEDRDVEGLTLYLDMVLEVTSGLDVTIIYGMDSIRICHPEKFRIGKTFSRGGEGAILRGEVPYIIEEMGTLGHQRGTFRAVTDSEGTIIGFVMASVLTESIRQMRDQILLIYGALGVLLLGFGFVLAHHSMNYLERLFMGYQPEESITKYMERSEVLDVLDEGIFAMNPKGEVILMNQPGRTMLGLDEDARVEGECLKGICPKTRLLETMKSGQPGYDVSMVLNGDHIVSNRIPVWENHRIAGAISIFRDGTEVMRMAEKLTGARDMLDTLRAFNHEFMSELHMTLDYFQLGDTGTAVEYISNTTLVSSQVVKDVSIQVHVPHLSTLVIRKMMRASELGIHLILRNGSQYAKESLMLPVDVYMTIVRSLLEDAIEELNSRVYQMKDMELGIYCKYDCTVTICEDTEGGIPEDVRENIFQRGTSAEGEGRGTGLPLVKELTDRYYGEITIEAELGEETCITISLMRPEEEDSSCTR